jgi:hypothetical protein
MKDSGLTLEGSRGFGLGTIIRQDGAFDAIVVNAHADTVACGFLDSSPVPLYDNKIRNLYLIQHADRTPTGGWGICATYPQRLRISNIWTATYSGIHIHNFNDVSVEDATVSAYANYGLWLTGGSSSEPSGNRSDIALLTRVSVYGTTAPATAASPHGIVIDGAVQTVELNRSGASYVGIGLWIRNQVGSPLVNPTFGTFHDFESEFTYYENIRIDNGNTSLAGPSTLYFIDAILHHPATRDNVFVADRAFNISFVGGQAADACFSGFNIAGSDVSLVGVHIPYNSGANTCNGNTFNSAITLQQSVQRAVISGTKVGSWANVGTQDCAVKVIGATSTSVTTFNITGNSFFNNRFNTVCDPGNGGTCSAFGLTGPCSQQRVIAYNSCGPGGAYGGTHYCHFSQANY